MHKFSVCENVEFTYDGVRGVGCIDSINEAEETAEVYLDYYFWKQGGKATLKLTDLTLIPFVKCSGERIKDFFHFDCSKEQLTEGQWYSFFPEYNVLYTEDDFMITMDDVKQGIEKIEALDMWDSDSYFEWKYIMGYQIPDLLLDYNDGSETRIEDDAMDLVDAIYWACHSEGEYGKEFFFEVADAIQERYRLELVRAS